MNVSQIPHSSLPLLLFLIDKGSPVTMFVDRRPLPFLREIVPFQIFRNRSRWSAVGFWEPGRPSKLQRLERGVAIFAARISELPPSSLKRLAELGFSQAIFEERAGVWLSLDLSPYRTSWLGRLREQLEQWFSVAELFVRKAILRCFAFDLRDLGVEQFRNDGGFCYIAYTPFLTEYSERSARGAREEIFLFEENIRLMPRMSHEDIRKLGGGRCSFWKSDIFFSATDGSDPNVNGRRYRILYVTGRKRFLRPLFPLSSRFTAPKLIKLEEGAARFRKRARPAELVYTPRVEFEQAAEQLIPQGLPLGYRHTPGSSDEIHLLISSLGLGGAERQMCYLARMLQRNGIAVRVLTWEQEHEDGLHYLELLRQTGIPVNFVSRTHPHFRVARFMQPEQREELRLLASMPQEYADSVWSIYTHLMVHRPKILHCWLDSPNILGGIAGWLAGTPRIILSARNLNPTHFPHIYQPWHRPWYARFARSPRFGFIANSHAGAKSYAEWLGVATERFSVVHNGLELEVLRTPTDIELCEFRLEHGIPLSAPLIVGVFRLNYDKRPSLFLKVFSALSRELRGLHAIIAGVGPLQSQIEEEISDRGLSDKVKLLGQRTDIPLILRAADLCLLTSSEEGLPNVLMEAQWFERPVVCTRVGGTSEIVRDGITGYICDQGNFRQLVERCRELLNNPLLRRSFGQAGKEWITQNFSLERMYRDTLETYGSPVPSGRTAPPVDVGQQRACG